MHHHFSMFVILAVLGVVALAQTSTKVVNIDGGPILDCPHKDKGCKPNLPPQ